MRASHLTPEFVGTVEITILEQIIKALRRMTYSVEHALNHLAELLKAVEEGEHVTLTRGGEPVADLVPYKSRDGSQAEHALAPKHSGRKFGTLRDYPVVVDPDWDRPQNDVEAWLRGDV